MNDVAREPFVALAAEPSASARAEPAPARRTRVMLLALLLAIVVGIFAETLASMIDIWRRSETFAHGFFIFPLSAWLVWRLRHRLARTPFYTDFRPLALMVPAGFGWALGNAAEVLVVQQFAFVAFIPLACWLMLGWHAARAMAFPLGFLVFAVPVGEALIPPMMEFTAVFTVRALQLTGIPVYWEGLYFTIPSGTWNIVEACSGVRYLIASVTLGFLYAYLTYYTFWRRALLVALAVLFPIAANGLRAYMIVMIGHLSEMRYATGVDHLIYGWVFFGFVMLALFWVGNLWREREDPPPEVPAARPAGARPEGVRRVAAGLLAGVLVVAAWPAWAAYLDMRRAGAPEPLVLAPAGTNGWTRARSFTRWAPRYLGATLSVRETYQKGAERVGIFLAYYATQEQGAELVNSQNIMIEQKHPVWRMPYERSVTVEIGGEPAAVRESELESAREALVAWHWYWLTGEHLSNPYVAKAREAIINVLGGSTGGSGIVVFTPRGAGLEEARARLQRFLDEMLPVIEAELAAAGGS